jgi:hypothetical protein
VHTGDDVLVYLRESIDERVLVQVSRAPHDAVVLDQSAIAGALGARRFGSGDAVQRGDTVELPAGAAGVHIWELEPQDGPHHG